MSSIDKRSDGKWRARYHNEEGRQRCKHFARKVDAKRFLDEIAASMVTGTYVDPRQAKVRLRDYAKTWEAQQIGRPATAAIIDNALRLHVLPALGDRTMSSIRPSDVQSLVRKLNDAQMAPGSVRNVYDVVTRLFRSAVDDRVIATTPCRRITLPRQDQTEVTPPTVERVVEVVDVVPVRYRALVVLLAGSGLRIGEALGLMPSDIDFLRRTVRVERQRLQDGSLGPAKSAKSVRTVPLGQVVVDELAAHLASGYGSEEALFTTPTGSPLAYRTWKRVWRMTVGDGSNITTHDLRHFYASALIAGGASVKQVQTVLGHSSAVITLRTYAHLWPGDEDRTRSVMDTTLGALRHGTATQHADFEPSMGREIAIGQLSS